MRVLPLLALLLVCVPLAAADLPEERVHVTVVAILANGDGKVDKKLKDVADHVGKSHRELTGFHMGRMTCQSLALGKTETFQLEDGQEVTVSVKRCTERAGCFCLEIKSKALVGAMTYSSVCGKYVPLITGHRTKDNDQLIIAFKVETCGDKPKDKGKEKK